MLPAAGLTLLPHLRSQRFPQLEPGAEETHLNGCDGTTQDVRDLLDREFFDIPQHEDRSTHGIQTSQARL